jgi:hypothetical protein
MDVQAPRGSALSNGFQRDAYLAALEPPRLDLGGGRVLAGRILSADEWFRYEDRLELAARDQLTRQGLRDLIEEMTDLTFAPVSNGRRWPFHRSTPASTLLFQLPFGAQLEAFRSFTLAQADAQRGTTLRALAARAEQQRTHGTRSSG